MGLDMYLKVSKKIQGWTEKDYSEVSDLVCGLDIQKYQSDPTKVDIKKLCTKPGAENLQVYLNGESVHWFDIMKKVGYWRKANHIHQWFVNNVQNGVDDCGYYFVSEQDLLNLDKTCEKVLENFLDSPKLLPRLEGFCFGGLDYNQYYLEDVKETRKIIDNIIESVDFENEVVMYHASW